MRNEELEVKKEKSHNSQLTLLLLAVFFVLGGFFSCKKNNGQLELQNLVLEESSPRSEWALISDPYVASRKEASYESQTISSFRKGEIYEIKGNCTIIVDEKKELWYALENGWVSSSAVRVFSNKLQAEKAKKSLGVSD